MRKVAIIGSTGSIGTQALEVIRKSGKELEVFSLAAGSNKNLLEKQIAEFSPVIATLEKGELKADGVKTVCGEKAFLECITPECDVALIAVGGFVGYYAIKKCIRLGVDIAVACKEAIVSGGELLIKEAKDKGMSIYPVDSEHSAIWQCLGLNGEKNFKKLIITASGGALRDKSEDELQKVTVEEVLAHPNWKMGKKITVDCATMMNKGFEVIEAMRLFETTPDEIEVLLHRESIIHSMVEFEDGAVLAQLGTPTMEIPISLALYGGERRNLGINSPDFATLKNLTFEKLPTGRYPCFDLAIECAKKGGLYPALLSGADECATEAFLKGEIGFTDIYGIISDVMEKAEKDIFGLKLTEENIFYADSTVKEHFREYKCKH